MRNSHREFVPFISNGSPATVLFAGSLSAWYGPMLERLVLASSNSPLRFEIFGSHVHASWSRDFDSFARTTGVYRGQVAFDQLKDRMLKKPICCCYRWVLVMSALKPNEQALRQSFLIT